MGGFYWDKVYVTVEVLELQQVVGWESQILTYPNCIWGSD